MKEYSDNVKRILISDNEKDNIKKLYEQAAVDLESRYTDFTSKGDINDPNAFVNLFSDLSNTQQIELLKIFINADPNFGKRIANTYSRLIYKMSNPSLYNSIVNKYNILKSKPQTATNQPNVGGQVAPQQTKSIDDFKAEMRKKSEAKFKELAGQELASKNSLIIRDPELKELQTKLGVNADGVLGPNTWNKIKQMGLLGIMIRALDTQKGMAVDQKQKVAPLAVNKSNQVKRTTDQGLASAPDKLINTGLK